MKGATLFSGGRGAEAMLTDLIDFAYSVEYDPAIAAVGAQLGGHTFVNRVEDVDYSLWGALDYLHASPVCKEYSAAKTGGAEGEGDIQSALAVVRCLEATQPRVFTLENVGAYQHGKAYRLICQALDRGGYMWHAEVLNSADFGVPQTRRRLILRAVRDALLPTLPPPVKWVGWYAAIEDLIPTLPESQFAPWQLARLPEGLQESTIVHRNDMRSMPTRSAAEPVFTITAGGFDTSHMPSTAPRAFIVDCQESSSASGLTVRDGGEPMYTVSASMEPRRPARAFLVGGANTSSEQAGPGVGVSADIEPTRAVNASNAAHWRAWLSAGRVVKMTPRALARFQSFPDSYVLPERASLACTIVGNAVASLMMRRIVEQLI